MTIFENMRLFTESTLIKISFCISIFIMLGCNGVSQQTSINNTSSDQNSSLSENSQWVSYINSNSDSLSFLYAEDAVKILSSDDVIKGNTTISHHLLTNAGKIKSIETDTLILANKRRKIEYELGSYFNDNDKRYVQVIIWQTKDSNRQRVFEFASPSNSKSIVPDDIHSRRREWVALCNAHNAEALINEMYSENTLYFNHKPLLRGRDQVIADYQYMNNEKYKLDLNPIVVEAVNDHFVFEIGQCSGSYNGKYIIIWQKNSSGKWEVYIDSNI